MCRLFGMSGGPNRVGATFWLLEAPDSLARQSRREPDGTGVGCFTQDGKPEVFKQPLAAHEDQAFAQEARELHSRTFVAHIRYASTGAIAPQNTHPFEQAGRLFAHNGVIEDLATLERELGDRMGLVRGETDSERFCAPGSIRVRSGDLARLPAVVVASEQMDEDPGWRALRSGELLHVDGELKTTIIPALNEPPAHQLTLADLGARAASSQAAGSQATTPAA